MAERMLVVDVLGHVAERMFDDPNNQKAILEMPFMQVLANNTTVMCGLIELQGIVEDVLQTKVTDAARKNLVHISDDLEYEHQKLFARSEDADAFEYVDVEESVYGLG